MSGWPGSNDQPPLYSVKGSGRLASSVLLYSGFFYITAIIQRKVLVVSKAALKKEASI